MNDQRKTTRERTWLDVASETLAVVVVSLIAIYVVAHVVPTSWWN